MCRAVTSGHAGVSGDKFEWICGVLNVKFRESKNWKKEKNDYCDQIKVRNNGAKNK